MTRLIVAFAFASRVTGGSILSPELETRVHGGELEVPINARDREIDKLVEEFLGPALLKEFPKVERWQGHGVAWRPIPDEKIYAAAENLRLEKERRANSKAVQQAEAKRLRKAAKKPGRQPRRGELEDGGDEGT